MTSSSRSPSLLPFLAACLVLPPVAIILAWMRPIRLWKKLLWTVALAAFTVVHLVYLYGLRLDRRGSGFPMVRFGSQERRYAALEQSRAAQGSMPAATPEAPAAAVSKPEPTASGSPETAPAAAAKPRPASVWTDFRGPQRDGVYRQSPILTTWPANGLTPLWKQPIGEGYASFVTGEGRAYTIEQRRDKEFVAAYDLATGKEVWTHSYAALFKESMGGDGPRATPTYHAGLVYALGATGELRVLDARSGVVRWAKNILTDNQAANIMWGMSAAPLIVDDKVILQPGGAKGNSIVAYDRLNGNPVWKSLDDKQAYTSPMLVQLAGRRQILTVTAKRVIGLDPDSGNLLWEFPWVTEYDVNSAQPVLIDDTHFVISAGYGHGAALVELKVNGAAIEAKEIWKNNRMKTRFNSAVLHEGHIYGLDENILQCIRVSDGVQMWKGGRYGYGQILLASGHLVVLTEAGELALVPATPEKHTEIAKFQAIDGKTWNVPAIENGILLVRNGEQMAAFRLTP